MIYNDELKCIHKNLLSWYGLSGECFYVSGNSGQDSTTDSDSTSDSSGTSGSNSTFPEKEYDNIIIVPDESMDIISMVSGAVSLTEALYRDDTVVAKNRETLDRVFVRKPILVEDHF